MIAVSLTIPSYLAPIDPLLSDFGAYVASDGGTMASTANTSRVIGSLRNVGLLNNASLVCTCDSGKASNLYYLTP